MSITPFWSPVVPLEYGSAIRSSAGSISTCGRLAVRAAAAKRMAWRLRPRRTRRSPRRPSAPPRPSPSRVARARSRAVARPSRTSCLASSSSVSSGFAVVFTPPADATPWKAIAYSGRFGAQWANTSPLPKPRAASPAANRRTAVDQLAVGDRPAARAVDQRRLVRVLAGAGEDEVGERNIRNLDVRIRAADHSMTLLARCLAESTSARVDAGFGRRRSRRFGQSVSRIRLPDSRSCHVGISRIARLSVSAHIRWREGGGRSPGVRVDEARRPS